VFVISQNVLVFVIAVGEYHEKIVRMIVLIVGALSSTQRRSSSAALDLRRRCRI
jgi:hypothetical protein